MKIKDIVSLLAGAFIALLLGFTYTTTAPDNLSVGGGLGTIDQLSQWFFDGTNITQNTSGTPVKLTGYESSGDCLVTNASGVVSTSTCGGGGSSKWTDGGSFIFPTAGESVSGSFFSGTSTTATSTFVTASSTRFCLGSDCRTTWPTGTVTSVAQTVPTGFTITGSPVTTTGTLAIAYDTGYGAILTASTTEWATAYASTTALTPSYIRGLFSNTATGLTYTAGTGATSLTSGYDIPLSASTTQWSGFYNTPSTKITAGSRLSWSGNTLSAALQISTSSSNGALAFWTGTSALGSVATGTLTETVTGLELSATRGLVGGAAILALTSGYGIPLTASTTEWTNFYNTPSGRITAGTGLSWSGNTLNNPAYWSLMSGGLRTATSTDFAQAAYFVATSTTGTSTFAHNVNIGTSTVISRLAVQGLSSGSILQLLSNTGIKFMEMLNTGVTTLLGAWDWGGATSIEIVNGSAPTVDATGEIAVDTTSDQYIYYGSATKRVLTPFDEKSAFIASTTIDKAGVSFSVGTSTFEMANYSRAVTLDTFYCKTNTGTTTVRFGDGTNWTAVVVCGPGGGTGSSLSNNTFTAREDVQVQVGSAVGTPAKVTVSASFLTTAD